LARWRDAHRSRPGRLGSHRLRLRTVGRADWFLSHEKSQVIALLSQPPPAKLIAESKVESRARPNRRPAGCGIKTQRLAVRGIRIPRQPSQNTLPGVPERAAGSRGFRPLPVVPPI